LCKIRAVLWIDSVPLHKRVCFKPLS
jgi:hypothetical protein